MRTAGYDDIRPSLRMGDVIAFGGYDWISKGIKLFTRSPLSHVAVVLRIGSGGRVAVIESTTLDGRKGVQTNFLSERVEHYNGDVWALSLSESVREAVNWARFITFMDSQEGKPYDYRQCLQMAWAPLAHAPGLGFLRNHESLSRFYCSELVAAGLEYSGGLPFGTDCSDVTPQDLCSMALYSDVVQIKGAARDIPNFNTRALALGVAA
jgi:hypothetical protein